MSEPKETLYPLVKEYKQNNDSKKKEEILNIIKDNLNNKFCVLLPYRPDKLNPQYGFYYEKILNNKKSLCVFSKSGYSEIIKDSNDVIIIIEFIKLFSKIIKDNIYDSILIDDDGKNYLEITKEEMIKILNKEVI